MDHKTFWVVVLMLTMTVFLASMANTKEKMTNEGRVIPIEKENASHYDDESHDSHRSPLDGKDKFGGMRMFDPNNSDDMMAMMGMGIMGGMHEDKLRREKLRSHAGVKTFCPQCPTNIYAPVCDKANQVTYKNKCLAECNGVYNSVQGMCGAIENNKGKVQDKYIKTASYTHCQDVYDPVVDSNGEVYRNICFARTDAKSVLPFTRSMNKKRPCNTTKGPTSTTVAPPGGIQDAPISEEAKQAAFFTAQQLSTKPEFVLPGAYLVVDKILKVQTQVVAGLNYYIAMNVKTKALVGGILRELEEIKTVDVIVLRKLSSTTAPIFELTKYTVRATETTTMGPTSTTMGPT